MRTTTISKVKVSIVVGLCVLLLGGIWYVSSSRQQTITPDRMKAALVGDDVAPIRRMVKQLITEQSAPVAYTTMKQIIADIPLEQQHLSAHLFGESVYRMLGVDGISVCDDAYGFGCYHGFFGTAIATQGPDALVQFDKVCVEKFGLMGLGCPHGIGHGLGEYYGPGRLSEQLAVCGKLSWQGERFGCSGGVFMEYNYPTMVTGAKALTTTRTFVSTDPYAPCTTVASRFTKSCYLELAAWYYDTLSGDIPKINTLCSGIPDVSSKRECYRGLGLAIVPHMRYDMKKTLALCDSISTAVPRRWCYAGASWSFFAHPEYTAKSEAVCSGLPATDVPLCRKEADLLNSDAP